MSFQYYMGNQTRAAQIAREIVKPLAVSDLECMLAEQIIGEETEKLYTAVDPDYSTVDKRAAELKRQIESLPEEAKALCGEYSDLLLQRETTRQIAWFNLGFQAAIRLLGAPPELHIVDGGVVQRKRVAS
jgi:hypothetical protein